MDWTSFDVEAEAAKTQERAPLPPGEYTMRVLEAEEVAMRNGKGEQLSVKFVVEGGEHNGTWFWDRLTLSHSASEAAVSIGRKRLGSLCVALGVTNVKMATDLEGRACKVRTKMSKPYEGKTRPEAAGYSKLDSGGLDGVSFETAKETSLKRKRETEYRKLQAATYTEKIDTSVKPDNTVDADW